MQMSEETFEILLDVMEKHFAALKLLDDEPEHKLTRTVSFSDLPSRTSRILIEQCFQTPESPSLMRQYSCEQIVNKANNIRQLKISESLYTDNTEHRRTWETTIPHINNSEGIDWNLYKPVNDLANTNKPQWDEIEYMEVDKIDLSDHNNKEIDTVNLISPIEVKSPEDKTEQIKESNTISEKESYEEIKKKCRSLISSIMTKNKDSVHYCYKIAFFILLPIFVFLIAAFLNQEEDVKYTCNHKLHFSNASIELQQKIYGQNKVIPSLIEFLETHKACTRFAILVGSTGVGKSYTIDIIRRNFPRQNKILQYNSPLNKADINGISSYRCNLIVFENLRENDILDVVNFSTNIFKLKNTCITMLAVINVEKVSHNLDRTIELDAKIEEITAVFSKANNDAYIFGYKPLSEETLEKCIMQAMKDSGLKLNKDKIQQVKQSLLVSNSGCKGAYAKVQIIGRE
ncbi:uncharacterized protein LOC124952878 isoform X1 [Vespa velutina]|uniref:uncharacterized protein LOC124952878 isoform X1 n=2 Tax=Vespa velutina TaxID=202808 RepID=UPI001FB29874|nr:uncharacterized protein LOC124952878 isoform X1 [Vespa velutina]